MDNSPVPRQPLSHSQLRSGIIARFVQIALGFLVQGAILFYASGNLLWQRAWLLIAIYVISVAVNGYVMLQYHPETIAERGHPKEMKRWDKVVSGLWSLSIYLLMPIIAGLDYRLGWSGLTNNYVNITGAFGLAIGLGIGGWAMMANAFFSTVVRIQIERGHTVCQTGPYRFVRHPGYLGFILQSLSTPLLLGSALAFIPGIAAAILLAVRTLLEDRMLQSELSGYTDYAQRVRYRLIPALW